MPLQQSKPAPPSYSRAEFARHGDEVYEKKVQPRLRAEDEGKFAVIDIVTGDYEIDADELIASDKLLARHPQAQIWLRQIGSRYARRFGARPRLATS